MQRLTPGLQGALPRIGVVTVLLSLLWSPLVRGEDPAPHPDLAPDEVVRIQLEALRDGGPDDAGIAVAFRFASPENRRVTGPLARFARMIRSGAYAPMLSFTDAVFAPLEEQGRQAIQDVTLVAPGVDPVRYRFILSRQDETGGPLDRCWMTDAVQRLPARATQA